MKHDNAMSGLIYLDNFLRKNKRISVHRWIWNAPLIVKKIEVFM